MNRQLLALVVGVAAAGWVHAQDGKTAVTLKTGDPAPALQVGEWLQGEPVKAFEKDKVYVVEFWATWCGPCRATIPHVDKIHRKFADKGVVVIGQNVWERKPLAEVKKFIAEMGDKMTYRVAADASNAMAKAWMEAAGQRGIPSAFVVDKAGRIAWIGHPMDGLDGVVEDLLAGTFDSKAIEEKRAKEQAQMDKMQGHSERLGAAVMAEKWDEALAVLAEMRKEVPAEMGTSFDFMKFNILVRKKDVKGAEDMARKLSKGQDDPQLLNALAWELATAQGMGKLDTKLAEKIATRANEIAKGADAAILDTLARTVFINGNKKRALALQKEAIGKADDDDVKQALQEALKSYEKGELPPVRDQEDAAGQ